MFLGGIILGPGTEPVHLSGQPMLAFCHDGLCSPIRSRRGAVLVLPIYLESPGKMQHGKNNKSLLPHLGQNTLVPRYTVYTPKFIDKTKKLV